MQKFRALLQLTRLDTSALAFLGVFVPVFARTNDLRFSSGQAIPLLFIGMCTFIANDMEDVERDKINHPNRPLPGNALSSTAAAVLYFACLAAALFSTRTFVEPLTAFWYYALVAMSVSYGHVVERLPSMKAPYVAVAVCVPILLVATSYPEEPNLYRVAVAVFLFTLGRELCMDILDRAGDPNSLLHRVPTRLLATFSFCAQAMGLLLLPIDDRRLADVVNVFAMVLLLVVAAICWFRLGRRKRAIRLMKVQLLFGLYFLV